MAHVLLAKLQNSNNAEKTTEIFQIDSSADSSVFTTYLNTLYGEEQSYVFYFEGKRINRTIKEAIEGTAHDNEKEITVTYCEIGNSEHEIVANFDDTIIGLAVLSNSILALLHSNVLVEYSYDKMIELDHYDSLVAGDSTMAIRGNCIHDVQDRKVLLECTDQILEGYACQGALAAGTAKRIYTGKIAQMDEVSVDCPYRKLLLTEKYTFYIESLDTIVRFNHRTKNVVRFTSKMALTDICFLDKTLYCSTSNGRIVELKDGNLEMHEINEWHCSKIVAYDKLLIVASQYNVMVLDSLSFSEKALWHFKQQINCLDTQGQILYVAAGTSVYKFSLSQFQVY
ncbi:hypothetical protein ENBRE01_2113 [Enteropsectra breve]|nr:hypothetical protein ENBRE01_2113 [Enteropsectra breve]